MSHSEAKPAIETSQTSDDPAGQSNPIVDAVSDNETSEKSARDQLRNTSLASLANNTAAEERPEGQEGHDPGKSSLESSGEGQRPGSRGRSMKKRSLERASTSPGEPREPESEPTESFSGHARKRSRDVRSGDGPKAENQASTNIAGAVQEESEPGSLEVDQIDAPEHESAQKEEMNVDPNEGATASSGKDDVLSERRGNPQSAPNTGDQEMKDGVRSPRKKRSREQLDTEPDREQKIAATEVAKAQRRSDEINRADLPASLSSEIATSGEAGAQTKAENIEPPPKAAFGTTSNFSSLGTNRVFGSNGTSSTKGPEGHFSAEKPASSQAFASSGFAALGASSKSPFGALGTSNSTASKASGPADASDALKASSGVSGGFGSFGQTASSAPNLAGSSSFASSSATQNRPFGGSVFGGGFGGGFGSGPKLTSFAAPAGDAKLGHSNGAIKPIGSPLNDEADEDPSDTEGEGAEEKSRDPEGDETDERFQQQNVETGEDGEKSIFSARASLYAFKDHTWREGGKGIFKLNVSADEEVTQSITRNGRFIMRAHQTYRVLLNAPIFPQMKIGDNKGGEPSGKSLSFMVVEDGKPAGYMVKLSDVNESKKLYNEVKKLIQQS